MQHILFSIEQNVARITFNRPTVFNAMHHAMRQEVLRALNICEEDPDIRVVYITGTGKAFCAGQDLQEIVNPEGPDLSSIISSGYNPIVQKIRALEKPVLCAVNGVAAGAGANIAVAADITVAASSATFTQAFSKIGLIPDSGGTWTVPRLVGLQRAAGLMFFSDKITAEQAEQMGLIWKVLHEETFEEESLKMAYLLAEMPPKALSYTKKALHQAFFHTFEQQLKVEDDYQSIVGNTADYREGVQAFLEKRKPVFTGR